MRNYKRKTTQQWSMEAMKSAIRSVQAGILSQNQAARQYGIAVATLNQGGGSKAEKMRKKRQ